MCCVFFSWSRPFSCGVFSDGSSQTISFWSVSLNLDPMTKLICYKPTPAPCLASPSSLLTIFSSSSLTFCLMPLSCPLISQLILNILHGAIVLSTDRSFLIFSLLLINITACFCTHLFTIVITHNIFSGDWFWIGISVVFNYWSSRWQCFNQFQGTYLSLKCNRESMLLGVGWTNSHHEKIIQIVYRQYVQSRVHSN